jgi:hippurate hydrolase
MAILLELARRLSGKKTLPHNALLIFQPGEESPGGAKIICDTGILEKHNVKAVFGLHLWPGLEAGRVFTRENELMSHASELTVDIYGKSAHLAKAECGIDALAAAVELYTKIRQAEQALPKDIYRLMNFGLLQSGTVRNAVSRHTHMEGSLRAFQDEIFDSLKDGLYAIAADVEAKYGCTVKIHMSEGYPAVMNPPELYRQVKRIVEFNDLEEPSMTSEDFSWYQKHIPGVFFFLGLGDTPALHSRDFAFNESVLVNGADFFEQLAENYR